MRQIYLDHAATTPVRPEVKEEMLPFIEGEFGNPSAVYSIGTNNKEAISAARRKIAALLGAESSEIIFTSGGTESDNWALRGVALTYLMKKESVHIITSSIEHHAVLHTTEFLERIGCRVTYLDVDQDGFVNPQDVENAIEDDTRIISIMTANNEIGSIQPIAEIGRIAHENGILFHTDAVQAFGHIPISVNDMNIDLLSASAHKFGGPKGIGFLYRRNSVKMENLIFGGGQERGLRAGTENVAAIVGMAKAAVLSCENMEEEMERERKMCRLFLQDLTDGTDDIHLNGPAIGENRLPNNLNVEFKGVLGESMLIMLDMEGIAASAGSACSAGAVDPSHVLLAIGLHPDAVKSSLRFTIGEENTLDELELTAGIIRKIVEKLRKMK